MTHKQKAKAEVFQWPKGGEVDVFERLRFAAASKLCVWHQHGAGGGSRYVFVGDSLKLRFANHANTSAQHAQPDYNFVNRDPTDEDVLTIAGRMVYPKLCRQTAFALHTKLTVPKLKKLLLSDCFEDVCENEHYPNTVTKFIIVEAALNSLTSQGISERVPVRQEIYSIEDYNGF
jgi:hypothetical protein